MNACRCTRELFDEVGFLAPIAAITSSTLRSRRVPLNVTPISGALVASRRGTTLVGAST
jgi:hypothetical protein